MKIGVCLAVALLLIQPWWEAAASTVVFDFENTPATTGGLSGLVLSKDGLSVDIQAMGTSQTFDIVDNSGLQVKPPQFGLRSLDPFGGGASALSLTFSQPISSFSIDFGHYAGGSSSTDISGGFWATSTPTAYEQSGSIPPTYAPAFTGGSLFSYGTATGVFYNSDTVFNSTGVNIRYPGDATARYLSLYMEGGYFFLDNITVNVASADVFPVITLTPIPLPPSFWLFTTGAVVLVVLGISMGRLGRPAA